MKKFICTVCGYVYEGEEAPEFCPQCKVPRSKFKELVEIILKKSYDIIKLVILNAKKYNYTFIFYIMLMWL